MARERPVLFNGEMVRAILSGAKVQTRRPVKPQPDGQPVLCSDGKWCVDGGLWLGSAPAAVGDTLWVRESVYISAVDFAAAGDCNATDDKGRRRLVGYVAGMDSESRRCAADYGVKQTPSIHMPKWASRITLEVTDVRAERLLDVTEADAVAEGMTLWGGYWLGTKHPIKGTPKCHNDARTALLDLWQEIYGHKVYNNGSACVPRENPWVWALTFRRVTP